MTQKFSDRFGLTEINDKIQTENMNDDLRASIWNIIRELVPDKFVDRDNFVKNLGTNFFKVPVDDISTLHQWQSRNWFREMYNSLTWFDVYNLIEFLTQSKKLADDLNRMLVRENSAWRFMAFSREVQTPRGPVQLPYFELVAIAEDEQREAIEQALLAADRLGLKGVRSHIQTALGFYSDRENPNYRNAIKEAISAVESAVNSMNGGKPLSLGKALDKLSGQHNVHPALKAAFNKLYGYTSDEDGIRHALMEGDTVQPEESLYMIISCSAFCSYLVAKMAKNGSSAT